MSKVLTAPRPEVLHLPTLLRRVENGEIRIPDFQRQYVWHEKQVIELLESVYKGYPIGSLLFWRAESSQLRYDAERTYPMPTVEKARDPVSFLLDGQQRLSTLYGCLYLPQRRRKKEDIFHVLFDLRTRSFRHFDPDTSSVPSVIPLWSLFSPTEFLEVQRRLQESKDGPKLLEESVALHSTFQEYMVPTVTIEKRRVDEVVEIFERVNRTGTRLSSVDFMRAVTWSSGFDLGNEVTAIRRRLSGFGFEIEPETVVKILAVALDRDPTPNAMLELRTLPAAELKQGVKDASDAAVRAVTFLREELYVFSENFVPYEGQMLVLCRLFIGLGKKPLNEKQAKAARNWFLAASLNEALRGKPDHVVAGHVRSAKQLMDGEVENLDAEVRVGEQELLRRVIRGKALTTGVITVLALSEARSVLDGKRIPPKEFMSEFNPERFVPVLSQEQLREAVDDETASSRLMANIVIASSKDIAKLDDENAAPSLLALKGEPSFDKVLKSQVVSKRAFAKLEAEDYAGFIKQRAADLVERSRELTED